MILFRQKFKNNVKNEFMRDKCKINDSKFLIKATINFNDRLYEWIMKRKYSKRHSKKIKNYINNQIYENKTNLTRNNRGYNHSKTIFMKLNSMMFRKFRQKNKKKCVLFMWQKKSFCKKLQIEKRCSTTIQRYVEKKIQNTKKKTEKILIMKQSKFYQLILKTKNFTKLTNHKIFKTFWMKKNKTAIRRLRKSTQQLTILISTNLCFNDSKHFIQIQQKKLKSIKIKIIKRMRKW